MWSKGLWCQSCAVHIDHPEIADGKQCCSFCGRVVSEDNWSEEVTFSKDSCGQSRAQGTLNRLAGGQSASRERTLQRASEDMEWIFLSVCNDDDREVVLEPARRFYTIAVERNFTRGREKELVEAACLYVACRTKNKPYLLIDFAEFLGRNVYELGAVYLLLCKLLSLVEHENIQKPVDPSLFIHRFAHRLLGQKNDDVTKTALKIIASMKRDWMQTGRKPSGLCGAALYISSISHGHKYTKSQIVKIVHICEATLTKRLIEFESTDSGSLMIEEFTKKAAEFEVERRSAKQPTSGLKVSEGSELLCEHKSAVVFAHGLCLKCYEEFVEVSGGLDGGSEPPAFQRAQQERMEKECAKENADLSYDTMASQRQNSHYLNTGEKSECLEASSNEDVHVTEGDIGSGNVTKHDASKCGVLGEGSCNATKHAASGDDALDKVQHDDDLSAEACDESETLSDIDDLEVDGYIHNEEEQQYKKIIWEELNREYVEEQLAKEAAVAAAKAAYEANLRNCPDGMEEAQKLAKHAAEAVAKSRKERQQKRAAEARNLAPPQTAAEATRQMLAKKRLDSKINYAVLDELFGESNPKKSRTNNVLYNKKTEPESEDRNEDSKSRLEDEYEGVAASGDFTEVYAGEIYYGDVEEGYYNNNDYGFEEYD